MDVGKKRYEIGVELAALRRDKTEEELALSQVELLIKTYEEYGDNVKMFSPPPYGTIVELFQQIEVDMEVGTKVARKVMRN